MLKYANKYQRRSPMMITYETLLNFLANRDQIITICSEKGFTDLKVYIPDFPDQEDILQIFAAGNLNDTDMFDKLRTSNQLTKLLGYKISLYTNDQIPNFLKDEITSKAVSLQSTEAVAKLFTEAMEPKVAESYVTKELITLIEKFEKLKLAAIEFRQGIDTVPPSLSKLYNEQINKIIETVSITPEFQNITNK